MKYEVAESRQVAGEWVVEAINYAKDGEIYAAIFSGPLARERAKEYAEWKAGLLEQEKRRRFPYGVSGDGNQQAE